MNGNNEHKNRKIIRLQNWDYSWPGLYFITICTKNREHYFGEVINGEMQLSHVGIIANILWYEIKNHAKNVDLGEFMVMPKHWQKFNFIICGFIQICRYQTRQSVRF